MINSNAVFMFGIQEKTLLAQEISWLQSPLCAGVILFTRNYENKAQIKQLIATIRETAKQPILIAVDHEGGRVQRFKQDFSVLPAMAELGKIYDKDDEYGLHLAQQTGFVLAYELAEIDVDFSFAPVLDIQNSISTIIGNRAFHENSYDVSEIASAFYAGVKEIGMSCVGKHFPGHGNIAADSHLELPIDERDMKDIFENDLIPFSKLISSGIEAIMPAHVLYTKVDAMPAGFSNYWLKNVLRTELEFDGCIISDDLDMAGAATLGDIQTRINFAKNNCDMILLCNNFENMQIAFANTKIDADEKRQQRISALTRQNKEIDKVSYIIAKQELIEAGLLK